jgi:multidrug efflux pump subunit AcrA (membrane-fusion protein)
MLKPWIKHTLIFIAFLLFAGNLFLIVREESDISRLQIVKELVSPNEIDIVESIDKPGVISAVSEEHIYYNENLGSIGTIYIEEGQEVQAGDTLFSYNNLQLDSARSEIESKMDQIELRISQISDEIYTLENIISNLEFTDEDEDAVPVSEAVIGQYELQVVQKNHQIAALELEKEMHQQSLASLDIQQNELEISSPVTGIIKEINTNRNQPLITVVSSPFIAKGELTEFESFEVYEGLPVEVIAYNQDPIEGTLTSISSFPAQEPALDVETMYPFYVDFVAGGEDLKIGYHVKLKIIQNEIPNALVIPMQSLLSHQEELFVLVAAGGSVEKRDVQIGKDLIKEIEVIQGVTTSDLIIQDPSYVKWDEPFVTIIKFSDLEGAALASFRKKEMLMLMLRGFLK